MIDCQGSGRGVCFDDGESAMALLEGFTIKNGSMSGTFPDNAGGGVFIQDAHPTIRSCNLLDNAAYYGGGIYVADSYSEISHRFVSGNTADDGAGIQCTSSEIMLYDCVLSDNVADDNGGGVRFYSAGLNLTMVNCTIISNDAADGGGISSYSS